MTSQGPVDALAPMLAGRGLRHFEQSLTPTEIEQIANDPKVETLQTSGPVESETWKALNRDLFSKRPDIHLRVFGSFGGEYDLSFLPLLPNVRHFTANCIRDIAGIENVRTLRNLESLFVGIYGLTSFDFLEELQSEKLTTLGLGATRSKSPSLSLICRFKNLRSLYLEGQQKDIDVISELKHLGDLTLRSTTTPDVAYLKPLTRLRRLAIKLGGTNNLAALKNSTSIEYLELWQVKGLKDLSVVSSLCQLETLFLQSLPNVQELPDLSRLTRLRSIQLDNMKGLKSTKSLLNAPALEYFRFVSAVGHQPEQFKHLVNIKTLKGAKISFGSRRKNEAFRQLMTAGGKNE